MRDIQTIRKPNAATAPSSPKQDWAILPSFSHSGALTTLESPKFYAFTRFKLLEVAIMATGPGTSGVSTFVINDNGATFKTIDMPAVETTMVVSLNNYELARTHFLNVASIVSAGHVNVSIQINGLVYAIL